jgi:hypothetical protein
MQPSPPYGTGMPFQPYGTAPPNGYSAAPSNGRRVWLGDILALSGGLLVFLFSFAPFVSYPETLVGDVRRMGLAFDGWYMAWSPQMFMAPLSWLPIFAGLGAAAVAVVRMATGKDGQFLRFRAGGVQIGLTLLAFLVLFGYAVSNKQLGFGLDQFVTTREEVISNNLNRPHFAWGGYLMVFGALIAVVGALLNHFQVGHIRANLATPEPYPATHQWPVPQQPNSPGGSHGAVGHQPGYQPGHPA